MLKNPPPLLVLIIMDGWGIAPLNKGNAVTLAKTPNLNGYSALYPHCRLRAAGEPVGLPRGESGNSETGHLNLGAGRIVYQDLPRINMAVADGSLFTNSALLSAIKHAKNNNSNLHLLGLVGQGGVHSTNEHLYAILKLCQSQFFSNVFLHLFTDGRDSPPSSAIFYLQQIDDELKKIKFGKIATLIGRYYAMDRDNRWERTQKAYELLTEGKGNRFASWREAIEASYVKRINDEFLEPTIITDNQPHVIKDGDSIIFYNYRIDRPRQLTKAFVVSDFTNFQLLKPSFDPYTEKYYKKTWVEQKVTQTFERKIYLNDICFVTMTEYEKGLPVSVAFPPFKVEMPFGKVIAENGFRQLKAAETEKERFVTYYFNGQREDPFNPEDRLIIPSPNVATYDLQPEMSAYLLTDQFIDRLKTTEYKFALINFANPDMVGHTGVLSAGIKACEVVDTCVGKIVTVVLKMSGCVFITADHGNVEEMINLKTGDVDTEHSSNPVPFIAIGEQFKNKPISLPMGILSDVSVTILNLLRIAPSGQMTGRNLLAEI